MFDIDKGFDQLLEGGATAVMGCRAAKAGIVSLTRKLGTGDLSTDQKIWLQRKIISYKRKVKKCEAMGLMI